MKTTFQPMTKFAAARAMAATSQVGVVALEVNQQVLHVGVATDRFVGAPILTTMNGGSSSQILSVPMNLVLFDAAGCTGNAYILSFMVSDTAAPTPYAPGLLPRAAVGPGNTLYVETGVATTAQVLSLYFPFESFCQTADPPTPIAYPVVTATLEADLDELFKPPFHVEMR